MNSLFEQFADIARSQGNVVLIDHASEAELRTYAHYVNNCLNVAETPMQYMTWISLKCPSKNH